MNTTKVVTFTNFSAAAERAVARAAELAARRGATLHLGYSGTQSGPRLAERAARLAMRSAQLERQWGIEVQNPPCDAAALQRLLTPRHETLLVLDHATARTLRLQTGWVASRSLIDGPPCPLLLVQRDATHAYDTVLVPYESLRLAGRLVRAAVQVSDMHTVDLFAMGPAQNAPHGVVDAERLLSGHEWPPPSTVATPEPRLRWSDHLSTRRNRVLFHRASRDRVLPVAHQADGGRADLVVVDCGPATWTERLSGRTFQRRLIAAVSCDVLFLPDNQPHPTAADALRRLSQPMARPELGAASSRRPA